MSACTRCHLDYEGHVLRPVGAPHVYTGYVVAEEIDRVLALVSS